ncbi:hypothetical protein BDV96DRAFT_597277 [Lophiotrema nucula]|uniref:DUF7907 domain-containing protein n=1 Tax=Lophiotrema nucula TaxID=690887 RepID=A0A6A5ZJM6_9PLEO|nr:hypothetical protein BDV96DRAFT_597277 [Lophiotrema nucula]
MQSNFILSLLASLAAASTTRAPNFAITASLPPNSPLKAAQGWNLTSYHITPCYDYAVFNNHEGRTFYANGTASNFSSHTSNILSDGGSPPWPWGTIISAANSTDSEGRRNVYINCGLGTPGLEVVSGRRGQAPSVSYGSGEFYVCNSTLLYGPAITLYYREKREETPESCSDVQLKTKCLDDATEHEFQRDSWCQEA